MVWWLICQGLTPTSFSFLTIKYLLMMRYKLKGTVSPSFGVTLNRQRTYSYTCKCQNDGSVKLLRTTLLKCTGNGFIHLWLGIARKEMDCSLKKCANFFQFLPYILKKWLKTDCSLFFLGEIISYFPASALRVISY